MSAEDFAIGELREPVTPKRIQLKRTKGWRKPEGAIVVARPSKWGNPFIVGHALDAINAVGSMAGPCAGRYDPTDWRSFDFTLRHGLSASDAVALYRDDLVATLVDPDPAYDDIRDGLGALRGHDLACWCPLDQPCHADVLLELANP